MKKYVEKIMLGCAILLIFCGAYISLKDLALGVSLIVVAVFSVIAIKYYGENNAYEIKFKRN